MTDKKEVSILLLGIVAILAIVGLVLLFTSPAATGRAFFPPPLPPEIQSPAQVGASDAPPGDVTNPVILPSFETINLPLCPNGLRRTLEQKNIPYVNLGVNYACHWAYCDLRYSPDPQTQPVLLCVRV